MKHILITGGAGFIGSNTVQYALKFGLKVTVLDSFENAAVSRDFLERLGVNIIEIDIQDRQSLEQLNDRFDTIIHLAAQVSVPKSIQDPLRNQAVNVDGTEHVLQLAQRNDVKRFIFASSSAVYGDCKRMPLEEGYGGELQSPYAQSKLDIERKIDAKFQEGCEFVSLRFFNVYGPDQRLDSNYGAVVPIFIDLLSRGIQPTIYGTGQQSRDFVHVHDVARLLVDVATNEWPNPSQSIYNVGTGKAVTVIQLASHIHKLTGSGSSFKPTFQSEREGDIERSVASIVAIENDLGWKPEIQLEEGLRKLIEVDPS